MHITFTLLLKLKMHIFIYIFKQNLLFAHILSAQTRTNNYLVGDDQTAYKRRDNGCNGRDAIGDGHHRAREVRTEIDMINLITT